MYRNGIKRLLAVILSDFLSIQFLFWAASLYKYIRIRGINRTTAKDMLRFALPLIPNLIVHNVFKLLFLYL